MKKFVLLPALLFAETATAQVDNAIQLVPQMPLAAPIKGGTAVDPAFNVAVKRLTDRGENGGMATAEYSQLQAFSADETKLLVTKENGLRDIIDLNGNTLYSDINLTYPRWHPRKRNKLIGFNRASGGTIWFRELRLGANGTYTTHDLWNISQLGYTALDPGCWEDASSNGRYIALLDTPNTKVSVLDIEYGRLRATVTLTADVDWVNVSPSGTYLVVQYTTRGLGPNQGLVVYGGTSGRFLGHIADHHHHGDLGRNESLEDVFTTIGYTDDCANGAVGCLSVAQLPNALELGMRNDLIVMPPAIGSFTSCRNERNSGFCVHADDYGRRAGQHVFARELWMTRQHDGAVRRLLHHRSSSCGYFNQTRPVISPTGRYMVFSSDWARPNCQGQSDTYLVDLAPVIDGWCPLAAPQ